MQLADAVERVATFIHHATARRLVEVPNRAGRIDSDAYRVIGLP